MVCVCVYLNDWNVIKRSKSNSSETGAVRLDLYATIDSINVFIHKINPFIWNKKSRKYICQINNRHNKKCYFIAVVAEYERRRKTKITHQKNKTWKTIFSIFQLELVVVLCVRLSCLGHMRACISLMPCCCFILFAVLFCLHCHLR